MVQAAENHSTRLVSRRAALRGGAAAVALAGVAVPAVAVAAPEADPLVALEAEHRAARKQALDAREAADLALFALPNELTERPRVKIGAYRDETVPPDQQYWKPIYCDNLNELDERAAADLRCLERCGFDEEFINKQRATWGERRSELIRLTQERAACLRQSPWWPLEQEATRLEEIQDRLLDQICKMPAQTAAGLAVKLRVIWEGCGDQRIEPNPDEWDCSQYAIWTALQDAERMAGGAA